MVSLSTYFYTPWKRQKTEGFLAFSGSIEIEHWARNELNVTMVKDDIGILQW